MPCVRGPYSNIKKRNSFSIYRGKILVIFKENLDRVPPCPSTWHEDVKAEEKLTKKDPFSVLSKVSLISCLFCQRYTKSGIVIMLIHFYSIKHVKSIRMSKNGIKCIWKMFCFAVYFDKTPSTYSNMKNDDDCQSINHVIKIEFRNLLMSREWKKLKISQFDVQNHQNFDPLFSFCKQFSPKYYCIRQIIFFI